MYKLISNFAVIPPEKQVVKIRKTEADSDSDEGENHTCIATMNNKLNAYSPNGKPKPNLKVIIIDLSNFNVYSLATTFLSFYTKNYNTSFITTSYFSTASIFHLKKNTFKINYIHFVYLHETLFHIRMYYVECIFCFEYIVISMK